MIIGLLNQKGGVGKTTVTLNLAAYFAREGFRTLVVDADPQASALSWSSAREAAALLRATGERSRGKRHPGQRACDHSDHALPF